MMHENLHEKSKKKLIFIIKLNIGQNFSCYYYIIPKSIEDHYQIHQE